jgi:hypothetical protein
MKKRPQLLLLLLLLVSPLSYFARISVLGAQETPTAHAARGGLSGC